MVPFHKRLRHPQAQTCALFLVAGREGLEETLPLFGRYAAAVVGDQDVKVVVGARNSYLENTLIMKRLYRICDQVGKHLEKFTGICLDPSRLRVIPADIDILGQDLRPLHVQCGIEDLNKIDMLVPGARTVKRKRAACDLLDMPKLLLRHGEISANLIWTLSRVAGEINQIP